MLDSLTSRQTLGCSSLGSAWPCCARGESSFSSSPALARFLPSPAAFVPPPPLRFPCTPLRILTHSAVRRAVGKKSKPPCLDKLYYLIRHHTSNEAKVPPLPCSYSPGAIYTRTRKSPRGGSGLLDRGESAKDRSKPTASVSVCKGGVK